jgi:hypothetical protein
MNSSCGEGGCTTRHGTDRLSVPNIAAKACYQPLRHQWISEAKMLWLCIFMVSFSGRLRQLVRSSFCGPRRGIPLLTPRLPHTCYEEGASAGAGRFTEIPGSLNYFPGSAKKFPGLVPTGIRRQTIDETLKISQESASPDAESNVFPVIFRVHGNLPVTAAVAEGGIDPRAARLRAIAPTMPERAEPTSTPRRMVAS